MSPLRSALPLSLLALLACSSSGTDLGSDGEQDDLLTDYSNVIFVQDDGYRIACDPSFELEACFPREEKTWFQIGTEVLVDSVVKGAYSQDEDIEVSLAEARILADPRRAITLDIDHAEAYYGPTFKPSARVSFRAAGQEEWTDLPVADCEYEAAGGGCWTIVEIDPLQGLVGGARHTCSSSWCFDRLAEFLGEREVETYVQSSLASAAASAEYIEYRVQAHPFWGTFESGESYTSAVLSQYRE